MPALNMNDRSVAAKTLRRTTYFDTQTQGLALRVGARTRTWCFVYRNGGPSEWVTLGRYPAISLAEARLLVLNHRHALDIEGVDPAVERRREPEPLPAEAPVFTFADFVPVFLKFQSGRTKHWENEHGKIKRYLLPAWGPLPLKSITRAHVVELLDTIEAKGLTIGVNRVQAAISRMFTVALNRGLVDSHPAARLIKRVKERPRDRVLTDAELRALWEGLDEQPGTASDALRLRLLLGQRGDETAGMTWSEIDVDRALWTLPRPRTKTQQRPHVVPLPRTALALLERRRQIVPTSEPRVFPALTLTSPEHKALGALHGEAYEWKDLRRTVGTRLAELGFDETTIGRALNHARHTITAKHYNQHTYTNEIRQALTAWDTELQRILRNESKKPSRVLPLRRR